MLIKELFDYMENANKIRNFQNNRPLELSVEINEHFILNLQRKAWFRDYYSLLEAMRNIMPDDLISMVLISNYKNNDDVVIFEYNHKEVKVQVRLL